MDKYEEALKMDSGYLMACVLDSFLGVFRIDLNHRKAYIDRMFPVKADWSLDLHWFLVMDGMSDARRQKAFYVLRWFDITGKLDKEDVSVIWENCPAIFSKVRNSEGIKSWYDVMQLTPKQFWKAARS